MYRSKVVNKDVYLLECARYIDRNPLRAGLVKHPADYMHGSYKVYAQGVENKIIKKSPAYLSLAPTEPERNKLYSNYVLQSRPQEEFALLSSVGL